MYTMGGERGVRVIVIALEGNKNHYPVGTKSFDLFKTKVFNCSEHFVKLPPAYLCRIFSLPSKELQYLNTYTYTTSIHAPI